MKRFNKIVLLLALVKMAIVPFAAKAADADLSAEIQKQLDKPQGLYFPQSVIRYYKQKDFNAAWIKPQSGTGPTWQAMLTIDCVMAFGLSHDDYHPNELTYTALHQLLDTPGNAALSQQARYDILLTDAIITLINHLHFGKLNPYYSLTEIDNGLKGKLEADAFLAEALKQKDLMTTIASVQPKIKIYTDLQRRMQLLKGKYQDDCYSVPEAEVRKVAINMERLRWAAVDEDTYILINIPTYTLFYHQPDTTYRFRVIVGKPTNPTPTLASTITHFETAPEWRVPAKIFRKELLPKALADTNYLETNHYAIYSGNGKYIAPRAIELAKVKKAPGNYYARQSAGCDNALGAVVFRFTNPFDIYLHDTPQQNLFAKKDRDFSHGCIRVEHAEQLGAIILKSYGAASDINSFHKAVTSYKKQTFKLKTPVALHIVYITCSINDFGAVIYNDIYSLDTALEMALYNVKDRLTMR